MFGKRTAKPGGSTETDLHTRSVAIPPLQIYSTDDANPSENVIIRRSDIEAIRADRENQHLVQAVIEFVNNMTGHCRYHLAEINEKAVQVDYTNYYCAQVIDGGHSQFIHNSRSNTQNIFADACTGLSEMGAEMQLAILKEMIGWVEANPDEARQLAEINGSQPGFLEELDRAFHTANIEAPMMRLSAEWILSWPELRIVEDDDYEQAIRHLAFLNPQREFRLTAGRISFFRDQMTDRLRVAIGMAAYAAAVPEYCLHIGGGFDMQVEGEKQNVWGIYTNMGRRFAVVTETEARLCECIDTGNPPIPEIGNTEAMMKALRDGRVSRYKSPVVGSFLSHVDAEKITEVIQYAVGYNAAVSIDLLLRRAGLESNTVSVSACEAERDDSNLMKVNWLVITEHQAFHASTSEAGSSLFRLHEAKPIVRIQRDEIDQHAALHELSETA